MYRTIRHIFSIALLFSFFHLSAQTKEQIKQVQRAKKEVIKMKGSLFPSFELTTLDGKTITNADIKGKITLFNFWFTTCGPCIEEMPDLNAIVKDYQNDNVLFIAPTFEKKERVNGFLKRFTFDYQVVPDRKDFTLDLNVRSFPTHFVIDQDGYISEVIIGYSVLTDNKLRKAIKKLLN